MQYIYIIKRITNIISLICKELLDQAEKTENKDITINDNEKVICQNQWDVTKTVLEGNSITWNVLFLA